MESSDPSKITAEKVFHQFNDRVFGFVLNNVTDHSLAKDITQDIFLKVCLNETRIREIHDLDNYIFLIARNTLIDHFRKAAYDLKYRQSLKEKWLNPVEKLLDQWHYEKVLGSALEQLPDRQRTVYEMHRKEGLPLAEVAEELGISFYTAKNHLAEARKNLRQLIDPNMLYAMILITMAGATYI